MPEEVLPSVALSNTYFVLKSDWKMEYTKRGQFRSFEMEDFQRWANSPLWDDESSQAAYIYPLSIEPARAKVEGQRLSVGNPPDETYELGCYVCAKSPESHLGPFRWAIDFLVPDGTPILAALDGRVIEVQEHSASWGPSSEYRDLLNYITLAHANGEFTQYCHVATHSVTESRVRVGSSVKQGQQIGLVGKTGWTDRDHLHFIVFRGAKNESPFTFKSLKIQFV